MSIVNLKQASEPRQKLKTAIAVLIAMNEQKNAQQASFTTQPLDHGALNVPLKKRVGNIDSQIDQYKKEQKAIKKDQKDLINYNHQKAQMGAKPMFETLTKEQIKFFATKAGIKYSEAKAELKSMAHWQPKKAIGVYEALKELVPAPVPEAIPVEPVPELAKPEYLTGRENKVKTAKGTRLDTNLIIIEADKLIASHNELGNENPDYPQSLQPRDRSREASQQQIHKIANDLDPESLGSSNRVDSGAPIVGSDLVVESGNGRTIAIKLAYKQGNAGEYRDWLVNNAEYFGMDGKEVKKMREPVLVRLRKTEIDRLQFAIEANQDDKLSYSATERAKSDAKRLTDGLLSLFNPSDDGNIFNQSNEKFIQGFLNSLGTDESAQYRTTDGKPTQALLTRIKSALFSKAYNDDRLLEMVADQTKPDLQNVLNALSLSAPKFIEAQAISPTVKGQLEGMSSDIVDGIEQSLDKRIVNAILDATNVIEKAKYSNQAVTEYVDQLGLFGDVAEGVSELAVFIHENARSAKKLSIAFKSMAEFAEKNAVDNQNFGLFGEPEPVSIKDAVAYANQQLLLEYGDSSAQINFFDSASSMEVPIDTLAHTSATSPKNQHDEPSDIDKNTGNYLKGKIKLDGIDISIENPAGSIRSGKDKNGQVWENKMHHHYGYIDGTLGADGDELDVFIKQGITQLSDYVYVINQVNPENNTFDEHKIILGANSKDEAKSIYLSAYDKDWKGLGSIVEMDLSEFKNLYSLPWLNELESTNQFDDALNASGYLEQYVAERKSNPQALEQSLSTHSDPDTIEPNFKEAKFMSGNPAISKLTAVDAKNDPKSSLALCVAVLSYKGTTSMFEQENPIINHKVKGKDKVIQGIIIPFDKIKTKKSAQKYDPYTFSQNYGGWFIRLEHIHKLSDRLLDDRQLKIKQGLINAKHSTTNSSITGNAGAGTGNTTGLNAGGSSLDGLVGQSSQSINDSGTIGNSGTGVSGSDATGSGSGSNTGSTGTRKRGITGASYSADDSERGDLQSGAGSSTRSKRDKSIVQSAKKLRAELTGKALLQHEAEGTPSEWGEIDNIRTALPYLMEEQQDDILKAEKRLFEEDENGMLFTNGTGTGKTFTGLGAVKRFSNAGKKNVLIVTMSDKIARDFVKSGSPLNLKIYRLNDTTDNGGEEHSIVVTTFANLGQNRALAEKHWDLIVIDEAHRLMQGQDGKVTGALKKLRALSGHHAGFNDWFNDHFKHEQPEYQQVEIQEIVDGVTKTTMVETNAFVEGEATDKWYSKRAEFQEKWKDAWKNKNPNRTKVIFLSATPWAYVKSIDWAEGYLFHFTEPKEMWNPSNQSTAYNAGDDRAKFYMQNFGYTMRTNKLTTPDGKVDSGVNERAFAEKLKASGAMSGRDLKVPFDYDRKFLLVDSAIGKEIDRGLKILSEQKKQDGSRTYDLLGEIIRSQFDYLARQRLLEAIKADTVVKQIKQQIALNRKVIVFHEYNDGGGFSPFNFEKANFTEERLASQYEQFKNENPELVNLNLDFESVIDTMTNNFPQAMFINGRVGDEIKSSSVDLFNTDNNGKNLIVAQYESGATGISLHDTTGVHQRVLYCLGLPKRPALLRQMEGRISRVGQASNAIYRYLTTGTEWETEAFANVIAQRAETVDNLSKGDEATVSIKDAISSIYNDAEYFEPSLNDGVGGKAYDEENNRISSLTPFQKSLTYYYNKGKNRDKRADKIGKDWYATPEPIGLKMMQWSGAHKGDDVLEPSAGDGAIGRWIPSNANATMIEPSIELASRAKLANSSAKVEQGTFEDYNTAIKYDSIVMNPPFGHAGSLAYKHVMKACNHLRVGGRIVALIPNAPKLDELLEDFFNQSYAGREFYMTHSIKLPTSTFENANTSVSTRIIIIERHTSPDQAPQYKEMDYSSTKDLDTLFEQIEHVSIEPRKLREDEQFLEYGLILSPFRTNRHILGGLGIKDPQIYQVLINSRFVYEIEKDPDSLECRAYNVGKILIALNESGVPKLMPHKHDVDEYDSWQHDGVYERVELSQIQFDLKKYIRREKQPSLTMPVVLHEKSNGYALLTGYERFKLAKQKHEHFVPAIIVDGSYKITQQTLAKAYAKTQIPLTMDSFASHLFDVLEDEAINLLTA